MINLTIESPTQIIPIQSEMDMMCYPYTTRRYGMNAHLKKDVSYSLKFDFLDDMGNALHFEKRLSPFR